MGIWKEGMGLHRENLSRSSLYTVLSHGSMHTKTIPTDKRSTPDEQMNNREG